MLGPEAIVAAWAATVSHAQPVAFSSTPPSDRVSLSSAVSSPSIATSSSPPNARVSDFDATAACKIFSS